jgi:hypothetical protein
MIRNDLLLDRLRKIGYGAGDLETLVQAATTATRRHKRGASRGLTRHRAVGSGSIYQKRAIHCAPRTVTQIAAKAAVSTRTATTRAIESIKPSSSR